MSRHQRYRQRLKARMDKVRLQPCESCGSKRGSKEFAHIRPTPLSGRGRGLSQRYHDIRKHPECYALLCLRCHGRVDSGAISLNVSHEWSL